MPEYLAPGVYVEEISGGAKPIEAVGTSTACFIGFTEKAQQPKIKDGVKVPDPVLYKPIFLTSWEEYVETFGNFVPGYFTPLSVYGFFQNGGKRCYVVSLREIPKATREILSKDTQKYLQVRAKVSGVNGEQLRIAIKPVEGKTPVTDGSIFKLLVSENGASKQPAWQTKETYTVTFNETSSSNQPKEVTITVTPATGTLVTLTAQTKGEGALDTLWKEFTDQEVAGLTWEAPKLKVGSHDESVLKLTPGAQVNNPGDYQLKISKIEKQGKPQEVKIEVQARAAAQGPVETLEFKLVEGDKDGREVVLLQPVDANKTSNLIELGEKDSANAPDKSQFYQVWPVNAQSINLAQASDIKDIGCVNQQRQHLQIKPKKTGNAFKPLTVTVETIPPEEPRFLLTVERKNETTNRWLEAETRPITLQKETKTKLFNGTEERRKVLAVRYLDGQAPTLVDLLPLREDEDITKIDLAELWPVEQKTTMTPSNATTTQLAIRENPDERKRVLGPARYDEYQGDPMERTGIAGLGDIDDINFICMPDLMQAWSDSDKDRQKEVKAVQALAIAHCDTLRNRVVILDSPPGKNPQEIKKWRQDEAGYDSSRAMLYYPWVEVMDPATNKTMFMPPSGLVAGIWARNDTTRGVHKAPANEVVQLAIGLQYDVGQGHQEILNPNGVNCIRMLRGMGIRVWGARTLSQSDPEWKYINVRRLFHMIEQSIQRSTMWAVFEPNDQRLWAKLRRDVSNFLMLLYSQGMLFGATASQAFFVKCDEENNPKYVRDAGQVIIDIGIAPVKPAEFVIFRIRQWSPEDEQG